MPFSQRLGWIGVDVGTHTVKLAQAARDGGTVRLHRAAVIQRPTSWDGEDTLAQEQPISSHPEIRAALECGGFSGRDVVCSLPMNVCELRNLNVPPGSAQERRKIIAAELAEDWGELRHPMEFDFWEMESSRGEKGSDAFNVSVLAAPRLWVTQLWRDCREAGLDCWAIDGAPLAMARAVSLAGGTSGARRALAVDWGFANTTLCVVGDGRPFYTRRIHDCGFGRVLEAITTEFDVSLDEAQHLADTQGLSAAEVESSTTLEQEPGQPAPTADENCITATPADVRTQAAITAAAAEPLGELARQIARTLQFMESQRRHLQPAAVWLLGGGASMRNAGPYFAAALGLPVHVWKLPPAELPIACASGERAAVFGGAIALSASVWRAA